MTRPRPGWKTLAIVLLGATPVAAQSFDVPCNGSCTCPVSSDVNVALNCTTLSNTGATITLSCTLPTTTLSLGFPPPCGSDGVDIASYGLATCNGTSCQFTVTITRCNPNQCLSGQTTDLCIQATGSNGTQGFTMMEPSSCVDPRAPALGGAGAAALLALLAAARARRGNEPRDRS